MAEAGFLQKWHCLALPAVEGYCFTCFPPAGPRHPGSSAEAHPDDLAACGACAEPRPGPALGVLPSAYLSTATGVSCDPPVLEPQPGEATRLPGPGPTPRTPAQTEVPLSSPAGSAPPCAPRLSPPNPSLESPLHPNRTRAAERP